MHGAARRVDAEILREILMEKVNATHELPPHLAAAAVLRDRDGRGNGPRKKRFGVDADVASDGAMPSGSGLADQGLPAAKDLAGVAPPLLRDVPAGDVLLLLLPTPLAVTLSPAAQSEIYCEPAAFPIFSGWADDGRKRGDGIAGGED